MDSSCTEGEFKSPALPPGFKAEPKVEAKVEEESEKSDNPSASLAWAATTAVDVKIEDEPVPAPKMSLSAPVLQYTPPPWACEPEHGLGYALEVLKNGIVAETIDMDKRNHSSFVLVGRLPNCDVTLEHPSISRYHCILQYGEDIMGKGGKGWHVYDMGSTHGSKLNKNKLPPKQYVRLHVGFVLQFGGSSRIISLLGPESDSEAEWECSPTEMKQKMYRRALDAKLAAAARKELKEEKEREATEEGIDWGMDYGEDEKNAPLFALEGHLTEDGDAYYNQDPKKALQKFFEREGFDMEFDYTETGTGHTHKWICSIELPIEIDGVDRAFTAQATVSSSKKDAAVQCALEACRILDKHNVLRRSNTKARMKKKTLAENDYYDEDDDLYFDRTGQLELQREKRRKWALNAAGKVVPEKDTYESLCTRLEQTRAEMKEVQAKLDELNISTKKDEVATDSLDEYCKQLQATGSAAEDMKTKTQKSVLRQRLVALTHESQKLEKLAKIAKPVALPELKVNVGGCSKGADKQAFLRKMMMVGRKKKEDKEVEKPKSEKTVSKDTEPFKPEVEEEEDEDDDAKTIGPSIPVADAESVVSTPKTEAATDEKTVDDVISGESEPAVASSSEIQSKEEAKTHEIPDSEEKESTAQPDSLEESSAPNVAERKLEPASSCKQGDEQTQIEQRSAEKRVAGEDDTDAPTKKKRVRVRNRERKEKHMDGAAIEEYGVGCDTRDEQYATWLPPDTQSGDGKTKLHEKFAGKY